MTIKPDEKTHENRRLPKKIIFVSKLNFLSLLYPREVVI